MKHMFSWPRVTEKYLLCKAVHLYFLRIKAKPLPKCFISKEARKAYLSLPPRIGLYYSFIKLPLTVGNDFYRLTLKSNLV